MMDNKHKHLEFLQSGNQSNGEQSVPVKGMDNNADRGVICAFRKRCK
jgi:hypothetical protein